MTHASPRVVELPTGLIGKEALLDALATALDFPPHFGRNWDALYDLLTEGAWVRPHGHGVLVHPELPELPEPDLATYLQLLADASEAAHGAGWRLTVVVPPTELPSGARLSGRGGQHDPPQ